MHKRSARWQGLTLFMLVVIIISTPVFANEGLKTKQVYSIINKSSQQALDIYHKGSQDFTDLKVLTYDSSTREGEISTSSSRTLVGQQFYLVQDEQSYAIVANIPHLNVVVDVDTLTGVRHSMKLMAANYAQYNQDSQRWVIKHVKDDYYAILSKDDTNLAITNFVSGYVYVADYTGSDQQLWRFVEKDIAISPVDLVVVGDAPETEIEQSAVNDTQAQVSRSAAEHTRVNQWMNQMQTAYIQYRKGIDHDGAYGAQCVDLIYNYSHFLFHPTESRAAYRKSINGGNGGDLYYTASATYYDKIPYTPGFVAQRGDVIVFKYRLSRGLGSAGHSAVVESATADAINVITQDGSAGNYIRRRVYYLSTYAVYNYSEIVGILRPKVEKIAE